MMGTAHPTGFAQNSKLETRNSLRQPLKALAQQLLQGRGSLAPGRLQGLLRQVLGVAQVEQGAQGVLYGALAGSRRQPGGPGGELLVLEFQNDALGGFLADAGNAGQ